MLTFAILWIGGGVVNAGFVNANLRAEFSSLDSDPREARKDFAFAIGWSVLSGFIGIVITPFMTGFYKDGWTLSSAAVEQK